MTTPERLRRRQLIEGGVLILLGIFIAVQSLYFSLEDRRVRSCVYEKFQDLSLALEVRSQLTDRETKVSKKIWLTYAEAAGLIKDDPTKPLPPEDEERLQRQLVKNLLEYQETIAQIQQERKENPLPPYPVGTCTED